MRADPVNTATGAFSETATDLSMPGPGVSFSSGRSYSSNNSTAGVLGVGWSWSYDMALAVDASGAVMFRAEDGSQTVYSRAADGSYTAPPGALSVLRAVVGGWRLLTPGQRELAFDASGKLLSIKDPRGHGLMFGYSGGVVASVTDGGGRVVQVVMSGDLLSRLTLPDGRFVEYGYTNGQLTSARDAGGGVTRYDYAGGLLETVTDPPSAPAKPLAKSSAPPPSTVPAPVLRRQARYGYLVQASRRANGKLPSI
jgi:YD repeat-containing protein